MLNKKQRRFLFSKAQKLKAISQIGKEGITDNASISIMGYINKHELMKVSVLQNATSSVEEVSAFLDAYGIETVGVIGRVLVLYKENKELTNYIDISNIK